jgi:CheY-like chemotaxis protein
MKTILVVDDTPTLLNLVTTVVRTAKHNTLQAPCAEDALDVVEQAPELDALVTDIRMPGMNGFELAEIVRKAKPGLPILFISGFFDSSEEVHMKWLGRPHVSFLPKPFPPAKLLRELDALLAV